MIVAIDVHYRINVAKAVAVVFADWKNESPDKVIVKHLPVAAEYVPGEFYKRELPCILEIIKDLAKDQIDCIIVDGFVQLDDEGSPGLGAHLYDKLDQKIPVIGVAKSNFARIDRLSRSLYRGESIKPLYITSAGIPVDKAKDLIASMHGDFRMPALLQQLDTETKRT